MRVGLVGLSLSGKTAVFGALTGQSQEHIVASAHGGRPVLATVLLPDERLDWLAEAYQPKKVTPVHMEWVDLPGLEPGQAERASHNAAILASLRQVDLLVYVVRGFESADVPHPAGQINPCRDWGLLRAELLFADLDSVVRRIEKLEKAITKPTPKQDEEKKELEFLRRCREALEQQEALSSVIRSDDEQRMVRGFGFLTEKPALCLVNIGEQDTAERFADCAGLAEEVICMAARLEWELAQLSPDEEPAFMKEMGVETLTGPKLLEAAHRALGRVTFFTVSEKEVTAWSIPAATQAIDAAAEVHTDMARGFIRAEVISFEELRRAGSMKQAKEENLVRLEGKHYEVRDGDVIFFRFHV